MKRQDQQGQSFQKFRGSQASQQLDQQSRISKLQLNNVKKARNRQTSWQHTQLMKDRLFRSSFTIHERTGKWFSNCLRCLDSQLSFISILQQQQKKHSALLSDETRRLLKDNIIKLQIIQSSRLQLDPNVMHPFVKIHILDKNTGCYLKIDQSNEHNIYRSQFLTFIGEDKKMDTCENDMLLPFATNCCDFRELGDSRGVWNQKFYLNCKSEDVVNPNVVILFQILDFNHQALLYKDTDIYDKDNFYRVAWGFLRPVGLGKTHVGKTKIQLFKYKFRTKDADAVFIRSNVPTVYYDFIWNNHEKYEGFLTVQLNYCSKPQYKLIQDAHYPMTLFEQQRLDRKYVQKLIQAQSRKQIENKIQINHELLKFYRNKSHCQIPAQMIYKLQSSRLGCFRAKFIGNYLFCACSQRKTTHIKVFSLQNGQKVMTLKGHRQIIYNLSTNSNDKQKYLISAGSDHFVRLWQLPQNYPEYIDQEESEEYLHGQLLHTAAVYAANSVLVNLKDVLYTVTCCYDGYVRLWETNIIINKRQRKSTIIRQFNVNNYERSTDKVYPTCCSVNMANQFYIGDSNGDIRIYNFENGNLIYQNLVTHPDLSKDLVLSIQVVQRHLFVQSSDNMIRRFQISGVKLIEDKSYSGGQYEHNLLNAKISPDFKYLLAPSQNGKPALWDVFTATHIDLDHLNLNIKGSLTSCDWHSKYNLVVFTGFVQNCPIFVYGNVLTQSEMKIVAV